MPVLMYGYIPWTKKWQKKKATKQLQKDSMSCCEWTQEQDTVKQQL